MNRAAPTPAVPALCQWCDLPPAPPSTRFCDDHRREHAAILRSQLRNAERNAKQGRASQ